ncbi:MAG: helix-turn-helix transcriptional regulator [Actinomycetota bacterium]
MLVSREAECARIERLLADARHGRSASLVIRGEAGIGKSTLLRYAAEHVGAMVVRATRGIESEVEIPFSSLHALLHNDAGLIGELPGPQGTALAGALALGPPVAGSRFTVAAATLSLLAAVAEDSGLVVLVDDAHWLDAATAEVLLFAARRLEAEGVLLFFVVRDGEHSAFHSGALAEMSLSGLRREEAKVLLADKGEVASQVADRLFETTGGNPLALIELVSLLSPEALVGREPLLEPLPVGPRVEEAFLRRVAMLPERTRDCLLLFAASDTPSVATLEAAAQRTGLDLDALVPAEAAGLLEIKGGQVEFQHPLVRSAIYQAASPAVRRRAHKALAEVVSTEQPDRRAWHLARATAGPDESVALGLEQAAEAARQRAGPGAGASAFELAARLSPESDRAATRLLEAARDSQIAGRTVHSLKLLDEVLIATTDPRVRADATLLRARGEVWDGRPAQAFEVLLGEADRVEGERPAHAASLLTDAAVIATMRGEYLSEVKTAESAAHLAKQAGGEVAVAAEVVLAHGLTNVGRGTEARSILDRLEEPLAQADPLTGAPLLQLAGFTWMCLEDYERAERFLDRTVRFLRAAGAVGALPFLLASQAMLFFRTGRWANAYSTGWEAVRMAEEAAHESESSFHLTCLGRVEAAQGREEECRSRLDRAFRIAERTGVDSVLPWAGSGLGLLELGLGHFEEAIVQLERVAKLAERMAIGEPCLVQWAPDLAEAYAGLGERGDSEKVVNHLERQAKATGRAWAHAAAARCRGVLASDQDFERHFAAAFEWHERTPTPFERARTELRYGQRLGRVRRRTEARRPLRAALETFEGLGAAPWAEHARAELARNGGRVRPASEPALERLTAQELQVALAVADGATNKEAASALFLSPKTIEFHLGNAYRKLTITSRTQLARLLARRAND